MKINFAFFLMFFLFHLVLFAQTPTLVTNLNPGSADGFSQFNYKGIQIGNKYILPASNGESGEELYVIDENGISLLKDINPGEAGSNPKEFTVFNDKVYFIATDAEHGREIWSTDGTMEGTQNAIDLVSGSSGAHPTKLYVSRDDKLYFDSDEKLYESDGTTAGTKRIEGLFDVELFRSWERYASPGASLFGNGIAFYEKFGSQFIIWSYQDSELKKLHEFQGPTAEVYGILEVEKGLTFSIFSNINSSLNGLYLYDSALDSTYQVLDPEGEPYRPDRVWAFDENRIAFLDRGDGYFVSNGSAEGTIKISENTPSFTTQGEGIPHAIVGDKMVSWEFKDGSDETVLISDGTLEGTSQLIRLDNPFTSNFIAKDNYVFWANGTFNNYEASIWYTDVIMETAHKLYQFEERSGSGPSILPVAVINNKLYFISNLLNDTGRELYSFTLDFISSTNEVEAKENTYYKLNHVSGEKRFQLISKGSYEVLSIQLFDTNGRMVYQDKVGTGASFEANMAQSGVYFLHVSGEKGQQTFSVFLK